MARQQQRNGSTLDAQSGASILDRVLTFFKQEKTIRRKHSVGSNLETGMRFDLDAIDGNGYSMMHRFDSGLEVAYIDQFRTRPQHYSFKDMHTYFGFTLMLEGHILNDIPQLEQKERVRAGQIAFRCGKFSRVEQVLPAGIKLRALSMDIPSNMLRMWKTDASDRLNRGIGTLLNDTKAPFLRVFSADEAIKVLAEKMLETDTETSSGRLQYEATALSLLARILDPGSPPIAYLTRSQMREANLQKALDQAIDILRLEWSSPPTIAELARSIGLNHSTMQYEFRRRTGQTIGEYTHRLRMERARELIETRGLTVQETALHVGYTNPSYFSNAFRKYFGHLPSSCRQK